MTFNEKFDVVVIGAGPSGTIAASILVQKGWKVLIVEKETFPRFSIGESLLPNCMNYIEEAGMLETLMDNAEQLGFQWKNGAAFNRDGQRSSFDFNNKFTSGPGNTLQVKRASFDKLLADKCSEIGAEIRYQHEVKNVAFSEDKVTLAVVHNDNKYNVEAKFILDASGFGRVLPKLLSLELPSTLSTKRSVFCHIKDNITDKDYDRDKILITVHPTLHDVWYWLIPFADGTASIGVVGEVEHFDSEKSDEAIFDMFVSQDNNLSHILKNASKVTPVRALQGYSSDVTKLYGERFALLGNAGEFLDPVFSSGVTIAMCSASLAANTLAKQLSGEAVCWQTDFSDSLKKGIDVFKVFVMSWYNTELQDVIFFQKEENDVKSMICSILAGYAWDEENPYATKTKRRLVALSHLCQNQPQENLKQPLQKTSDEQNENSGAL